MKMTIAFSNRGIWSNDFRGEYNFGYCGCAIETLRRKVIYSILNEEAKIKEIMSYSKIRFDITDIGFKLLSMIFSNKINFRKKVIKNKIEVILSSNDRKGLIDYLMSILLLEEL